MPNDAFDTMVDDLNARLNDAESLNESLQGQLAKFEKLGWLPLLDWGRPETGIQLESLKSVAETLRDMAFTHPLHIRGAQLRHSYIFGRGVEYSGLTDKTKKLIAHPYNQEAVFSVEAQKTNNLESFAAGNLFVIRDEKTNILDVIPLEQIASVSTDPDNASRIWYIKREWTGQDANGQDEMRKMWYPLARYKKTRVGRGRRGVGIRTEIDNVPVSQDQVMYIRSANRQAGWTFGVPDSLGAAVWSKAYSEYLTDNATLVKALQQIAWAITSSTTKGAKAASISFAQQGVGGAANMGSGNTLSGVGVPSAQVNFNNGQPLAAMVATSFGVPVIALLSSPGATGGSYGAATTLDEPTLKGMKAEQDTYKLFLQELLEDMGSPDAEVSFPNISQDPTYRELQSLAQAYATGAISQQEYRDATLQLLDVTKIDDTLPKPDAFNAGVDKQAEAEATAQASNPVPSQGNSGAVAGGNDQGDTNHDMDE